MTPKKAPALSLMLSVKDIMMQGVCVFNLNKKQIYFHDQSF